MKKLKTGSTSTRCQNFSQKCVNDAVLCDVADAANEKKTRWNGSLSPSTYLTKTDAVAK